jgi:hypothetical protein
MESSRLVRKTMKRFVRNLLLLSTALPSVNAFTAGNITIPDDSNSRITVENAIINGNETTVLFYTWPDLGDPDSGKPCPINFYSVSLKSGLPSATADVVAQGVCSGLLLKGGLLENGDARMIVGSRVEQWRRGEQLSSRKFSSISSMNGLSVSASQTGAQLFDVAPSGDVVLALSRGAFDQSAFPGASMVLTNLRPNGELRWNVALSDVGEHFTPERIWAARDGGALFHLNVHSTESIVPVSENQLRFITAEGNQRTFTLMEVETPFDFQSIRPGSEEDMQRFFEHQQNTNPESIKTLAARARESGGFDVLFHRQGGKQGREGHFLYRLDPDGSMQAEIALGNHISEHGLDKWNDFYIAGDTLVLSSRVMATQHGIQARRKKWTQNVVSRIKLDSGIPVSRLIPLDRRYLEAAMNAGDAELQYLDGLPGGEPVLLTTVGDKPLSVSVGWISRRQVLRLNEAEEQLAVYNEAYEEKQAKLAKEASRQQRRAQRDAQTQRMQAAMAAAAGMSAEEFSRLSKEEQSEQLILSGNYQQITEVMSQEAAAMQSQQRMPSAGSASAAASTSQDMGAQIAAAMAQAQQHMTPEMRAQMEAALSQMSQGNGGQYPGMPTGANPSPAADPSKALPDNALAVDTEMRGFIEYENPDGRLMTLLIFDRTSGKELLKKDYADGLIYEYLDFSRFNLPPEKIGVIYREASGAIVKDLTPTITR